jgi:hypothetical protein
MFVKSPIPAILLLCAAILAVGCREQPVSPNGPQTPPEAGTADSGETGADENLSTAPEKASDSAVEPPEPPDPPDPFHLDFELVNQDQKHKGWVQVMKFFNGEDKATVEAVWSGGNRITVDTANVQYLSLDLGQLPVNRRKSVILRLDGHGIQLSNQHWPVVEFERGQAGTWHRVRD